MLGKTLLVSVMILGSTLAAGGQRSVCPNLPGVFGGSDTQKTTPWPNGPPPEPAPDARPPSERRVRRSSGLVPRHNAKDWFCVPYSAVVIGWTFISNEIIQGGRARAWEFFLGSAAGLMAEHAANYAGVINARAGEDEPVWTQSGHTGGSLTAYNYNNHQLTYGVLATALDGLNAIWTQQNIQRYVEIIITDGVNDVGKLVMSQAPAG